VLKKALVDTFFGSETAYKDFWCPQNAKRTICDNDDYLKRGTPAVAKRKYDFGCNVTTILAGWLGVAALFVCDCA
jgi:hypothetical protein